MRVLLLSFLLPNEETGRNEAKIVFNAAFICPFFLSELMDFLADERAQGAFEYILLLAGVLLVVTIAIVILNKNVLPAASSQLNESLSDWRGALKVNCSGGQCS